MEEPKEGRKTDGVKRRVMNVEEKAREQGGGSRNEVRLEDVGYVFEKGKEKGGRKV